MTRVQREPAARNLWLSALTYVAHTHARRPLYTSAAGKILLANASDDEMHRLLDVALQREHASPIAAGHASMALYHRFVRHDGVLARMLPSTKGLL